MRSLKLLVISLLASVAVSAQYVQSMGYTHYSFPWYVNIGNTILKVTDPSAYLEIGPATGATKGLLIARLTTAERNAIASPSAGLIIYNKTTGRLNYYNGSSWVDPADMAGTNSNLGSFFRLAVPNTNDIYGLAPGVDVLMDSTNNANTITIHADTTTGSAKLATQGDIDRAIITKLNITDTSGKWVGGIYRISGKDSIIFQIGSTRYAVKDSVGPGGGSGVTDGDKGEITIASSGTNYTMDEDVFNSGRGLQKTNGVVGTSTNFLSHVQRRQVTPFVTSRVWQLVYTDTIFRDGAVVSHIGKRLIMGGGYTENGPIRVMDTIQRSDDGGWSWQYHGRLPFPVANVAVLKPRFPGDPTYYIGESLGDNTHRTYLMRTWDFLTFDTVTSAAPWGSAALMGMAYTEAGDIVFAGGQTAKDTNTRTHAVYILRKPEINSTIERLYAGVNLTFIGGTVIDQFQHRNGWHYLFGAGGTYATAGNKYSNKVYGTPNIEDSTAWVELDSIPAGIANRIFYTCGTSNGDIFLGNGTSQSASGNKGMYRFDQNHKWHQVDDYTGIQPNLSVSNDLDATHAASSLNFLNSFYRFEGSGTTKIYRLVDTNYFSPTSFRQYVQVNFGSTWGETLSEQAMIVGWGVRPSVTAINSIQRFKDEVGQPFVRFGIDGKISWHIADAGNSTLNTNVSSTVGQLMWLEKVGSFGILKLSSNPSYNAGGLLQVDGTASINGATRILQGDLSIVEGGKFYTDGDAGSEYFTTPAGQNRIDLFTGSAKRLEFNASGILIAHGIMPTTGSGGTDSVLMRNSSTGQAYLAALGAGSGTVTSVATNNGTGITGGTITTTGTLAIDTANVIVSKAYLDKKLDSLPTGGGGSGTVNSGVSQKIAYYPSTGTTVDDLADMEYIADGTNDHVKFFSGDKSVWVGARTSGTSYAGVWFGTNTPSFTTPALMYDKNSGFFLNVPSNQTFQFRVNNANQAWLTDGAGFSLGTTNYNTDPGNNNMIIEGNLGPGVNGVPSERLHVNGNVRFSGALMPNNTAGSSGQYLTSAGAGSPPTWQSPVYATYTLNADKTFATAAVADSIQLDTEDLESGITHSTASATDEITFPTAGVYTFNWTAHAQSASADALKVCIQKWNGSAWANVANTSTLVYIEAAGTISGSGEFQLNLSASDKIRFVGSANTTGVTMNAIAATDGVAAVPAFRVTIHRL